MPSCSTPFVLHFFIFSFSFQHFEGLNRRLKAQLLLYAPEPYDDGEIIFPPKFA
jgi:hypothetical protein